MTVIVVQPDGDDGDLRMHGLQESLVGIGTAVMRHLQHVRADVRTRVEHGLLLLDLGVAGQEYAHAANGGAHDQRGVVGIRSRTVHRGRRRQHVKMHLAEIDGGAHRRWRDWQPVLGEDVVHDLDAGGRLSERTGDHLRHPPSMKDAGDATDVIQVVVTHHH
jgi:hypothetical protein